MAKLIAINSDGTATLAGNTVRLYIPDATWVKSSDGSVEEIVALTRAEYTSLSPKNPKTLYYITDEV
jgi:hypothetical protein